MSKKQTKSTKYLERTTNTHTDACMQIYKQVHLKKKSDLHVKLLYETQTTPDLYKILRQVFCTLHSHRLFFLTLCDSFCSLFQFFIPPSMISTQIPFHFFYCIFRFSSFYVSFMFSFRVFFCCHRSTILTFHDNLSLSVIVSKSFLSEWLFFPR